MPVIVTQPKEELPPRVGGRGGGGRRGGSVPGGSRQARVVPDRPRWFRSFRTVKITAQGHIVCLGDDLGAHLGRGEGF